jgi:hypothetical protein
MRSPARLASTLTAVLVGVVVVAGPAGATPQPTIPPDVQAAFDGDALVVAQKAAADSRVSLDPAAQALEPDFSGAHAANIHEVFLFTREFVEGLPTSDPLSRADEWWAALTSGNEVVGVLTVWKPDGGPAEFAGYSEDVRLGAVLGGLGATEVLIDDAPTGAIYALDGNTVRPLNRWAQEMIGGPASLSELQKAVRIRHDQVVAMGSDVAEAPGLAIALGAMALTLAVGAGLTVLARRRSAVSL